MALNDTPEDEARSLLASPHICEDPKDWEPDNETTWAQSITCGALTNTGESAGLVVQVMYGNSITTGKTIYQFSVWRRQIYGRKPYHERVYQLTIKKFKRRISDKHLLPHEHIGTYRSPGNTQWLDWTFSDAMTYFIKQTNIAFNPEIDNPEIFRLRHTT